MTQRPQYKSVYDDRCDDDEEEEEERRRDEPVADLSPGLEPREYTAGEAVQ